jgi:gag-polyprotein putative aspartyl protease
MTRMLVDGGAAINIMPYVMLQKIGKNDDDLAETDMLLKDFEGNVSAARGVLSVDLTVGSKTMPTLFFVVNGKGAYNLLLGRDWIHANCCVPSTLHQCVIQWVGDAVEVVPADAVSSVAAADMPQWMGEKYICLSGRAWDGKVLNMADFELPIQAVGSDESD